MGNTRDSAEKTSAGPAPSPGPGEGPGLLHSSAERKQMPPAQPRHFPALAGGVEESAGSRGITSCPGPASLHPTGYFSLEWEERCRLGCWAPSEQ